MTLSNEVRERLMTLISTDPELQAWLDDQRSIHPGDDDRAIGWLLSRAHAPNGDEKAGRLLALYRIALREPEITASRVPTITIRSAAWMVEQISPLLASEPELVASLREQQLALEANGQPRADAVAEVCRELLRMSADGVGPLGGTGELARAVRAAGQKIANASWKPEPSTTDLLAESAERSLAVASSSQQAAEAVPVALPRAHGGGLKITDTRHDRRLDHDRPPPSVVIVGGDAA